MPDLHSLHFRPPLGPPLTAIVISLLLALSLYLYLRKPPRQTNSPPSLLRRSTLLLLRLASIAGLAWLLAGPTTLQPASPFPQSITIHILADASASMAEPDALLPPSLLPSSAPSNSATTTTTTRWQAITHHWLSPSFLNQLRQIAHVQISSFDATVKPLTIIDPSALTPTGNRTNLYAAIDHLLNTQNASQSPSTPGIALLLSDGHDNSLPHNPTFLDQLKKTRWRIFAVPVGSNPSFKDVALSASSETDSLYPNQSTFITAAIAHTGLGNPTIQINLLENGRTLDSQSLAFTPHQTTASARFKINPAASPGSATLHAYQIVATPLPDERTTANNAQWVFLQVQSAKIKTALFEGQPNWDTRFLARALEQDPQIDLTVFHSLTPNRVLISTSNSAPPANQTQPTNPPLNQEELNQYDIIILGRNAESFFPNNHAQLLVDFVRSHARSIILASGSPFDLSTPQGRQAHQIFSSLLPADVSASDQPTTNLKLELAPAGTTTPLLNFEHLGHAINHLTQLPTISSSTRITNLKPSAIVLMNQSPLTTNPNDPAINASPAILYHHLSQARVFAILPQGLWQWAFTPNSPSLNPAYQSFWSKTVRWLALGNDFSPGQAFSLSANTLAPEPGQTVQLTLASRYPTPDDFQPLLQITLPDSQTLSLAATRPSPNSNQFTASFQPKLPGVYEAAFIHPSSATPQTPPEKTSLRLAAYDRSPEKLDASARPALLKAICDASAGRCLTLGQTEEFLQIIRDTHTARSPDSSHTAAPVYHFQHPAPLAAIALLLGAEWLLRRKWGLP